MSRDGKNPRPAHDRFLPSDAPDFDANCPQCQESFARRLWSWWYIQCGDRDCPGCVFMKYDESIHSRLKNIFGLDQK